MVKYQIRIVTVERQIMRSIDLDYHDDLAAIAQALHCGSDSHDVELWRDNQRLLQVHSRVPRPKQFTQVDGEIVECWRKIDSERFNGDVTFMDKFLHEENLKLFQARLTETTDEKQRQLLRKLIAEYNANYYGWQGSSGDPPKSACSGYGDD
jgi:hypothetical protein